MKSSMIEKIGMQTVVTPFVGVWIEIRMTGTVTHKVRSLPSWECGLKSFADCGHYTAFKVTPFVGVWIEIISHTRRWGNSRVTPFVGVWIEIV